jgi:hypothetical protein
MAVRRESETTVAVPRPSRCRAPQRAAPLKAHRSSTRTAPQGAPLLKAHRSSTRTGP